MTAREKALYLLAGKIPPGSKFFQVAAEALAVRTSCRWAGIGELNDTGDSVQLLAFWDCDGQAEPFSFQLQGSPCKEVYNSRPDDPHKFFPCDIVATFPQFSMLAEIGANSYRGEVFFDLADRPVGHVFVISEQPESESPDVRDFFRLVAQRVGAEFNSWKLSQLVAERTAEVEERDRLLRELEAKNVELERFTHVASHDLKSPLLTINGFLGLLKLDLDAGNTRQAQTHFGRIQAASERMEQLIDELLALTQAGRAVASLEEVDLGALACEAEVMVGGRIAARGVEIEISSGLPVVAGDRIRLRQLLQNLLDNAVKFMGDQAEPRIEIGARQSGQQTVCYVRDNGMGIESRYHKRIFELFERLNPDEEGTGSGLALVQRIVEVHDGRIWVESEGIGHGSTFCFVISAPRVRSSTSPVISSTK